MSTPTHNHDELDRLLADLAALAEQQSPPRAGPHPVDDDELLTCWSRGLLSEFEVEQFQAHLADCSDCRRELVHLLQSGAITAPDGSSLAITSNMRGSVDPAIVRFPTWATWQAGVSVLALAAALLLAVMLAWPTGPVADPGLVARDNTWQKTLDDPQWFLDARQIDRRVMRHELANDPNLAIRGLPGGPWDKQAQWFASRLDEALRQIDDNPPRLVLPLVDLPIDNRAESSPYTALEQARLDDALAERRAAAQREPDNHLAQARYAAVLLLAGEFIQAREQFEQAANGLPMDRVAQLGLGTARLATGDAAGAVAPLAAYIEAFPTDPTGLINLALAFEATGQAAAAQNTWRELLAVTRDVQPMKLALRRLGQL